MFFGSRIVFQGSKMNFSRPEVCFIGLKRFFLSENVVFGSNMGNLGPK